MPDLRVRAAMLRSIAINLTRSNATWQRASLARPRRRRRAWKSPGACLPRPTPPKPRHRLPVRRRGGGDAPLPLRRCWRCPLSPEASTFGLDRRELASAQPVAQRNVDAARQSVENLLAQAEAHLVRNPEDGRGWELLAPVYMRLDRYSDSVTAWRNTLQFLGESAERRSNLGEALTAEANGVVTADAKAAFVRAVTLDKTNVGARYYLGLAAEQDGQREKAAKIWRDLIAEAPAGAFWVSDVRDALARVESTPTARRPLPAPHRRWRPPTSRPNKKRR